MSIDEELSNIKAQKLASDMPDQFNATVIKVSRDVKKGQYAGAPLLKIELQLDNGELFSTSYRIPKAWTGKGQMDKLKANLKGLGLEVKDIGGKTFTWKRESLTGAVTGFDRHYPVKQLKQSKLKETVT